MEQLKPILAGVLRNRFWILCGVIAPVLMGGWFTETSRLKEETDERINDIKGWYTQSEDIRKFEKHPTSYSNQQMGEYIENLTDEVHEAWKYQYNQQAKILVWPEELREDFIAKVEGIRPIEKMDPQADPLGPSLRERYRDYIQAELPKLADIIGAKWAPASGGAGDAGMGGFGAFGGGGFSAGSTSAAATPDEDKEYAVLWDAADQQDLQFTRFDWSAKGDLKPSSLEILYAQEDLWVLRALMNIIASTNTDESGGHSGIIKEIVSIKMGSAAADGGGSIGSNAGGMSALDRSFLSDEDEDTGGGGMDIFGGMSRGPTDPAQNRYVDNQYKPVRASTLRTALSEENEKSRSKEEVYLVVAKRMPVRLNLVVDSRKIHRLISACGNSELVVEVRQVRINTDDLAAGGLGGLSDSDNPMAMMGVEVEVVEDDQSTGFEALGGGPEMAGGDATSGALAEMDIEEEAPVWELPVEIYGIVYIYNPVNRGRLNIPDEELAKAGPGETTEEVATEPATTPAPVTEAAATEAPTETETTEPNAPDPSAAAETTDSATQ